MKTTAFSRGVTLAGSSVFVASCFGASTASTGVPSGVIIPKVEGESKYLNFRISFVSLHFKYLSSAH